MPSHTINLPRSRLDEVLCDPPAGIRGTYLTLESPTWEVGDIISFTVWGMEHLEDVQVTEIEPPGVCRLNNLGDKAMTRYKTHWRPIPK